jgi:hypothetical protein
MDGQGVIDATAFRVDEYWGLVTQGSDAKRRSVATRGLNDFIPLGFRACKTAGGTILV